MSFRWIYPLLFLLVRSTQGQTNTGVITLSVQPNVTTNVTLCPNSMVVFTCRAENVAVLMWRINGTDEIITFTSSSMPDMMGSNGPFTALLISNDLVPGSAARNYVSNLTIQAVSDLGVGTVVECLDNEPSLQSLNVNYTSIPKPQTPSPEVDVTSNEDGSVSVTLTFDMVAQDTDMYSLVISGDQQLNCSSTCSPNGACVCTGLMAGDDVMVNLSISGVNCDTQAGPAYEVSFTPRVPGVPSACWILPVYNGTRMGRRTGVVAMWNRVPNPRNLTDKETQNVLNYSVSVRGEIVQVPVSTACLMSTSCLTNLSSYYNQSSSTEFNVNVASNNIFGSGPTQTCESPSTTPSGPTNTLFNVVVEERSRTVTCDILDPSFSDGLCQFCYGVNNCDSSLTCVNVTIESPLLDVTVGTTYCYRVTAIFNGVPVALIQDTFIPSSVSPARWVAPLLWLSVILCILSFFVLVSVAVIIIVFLVRQLESDASDKATAMKEHFKLLGNDKKNETIAAIILYILAAVSLLLSIIFLIAYGATENGALVAVAFPFSLGALLLSIATLVLEVIVLRHYKSVKINENSHRTIETQ